MAKHSTRLQILDHAQKMIAHIDGMEYELMQMDIISAGRHPAVEKAKGPLLESFETIKSFLQEVYEHIAAT